MASAVQIRTFHHPREGVTMRDSSTRPRRALHRHNRGRVLATVAVLTALAAGCSDNDTATDRPTSTARPTTTVDAATTTTGPIDPAGPGDDVETGGPDTPPASAPIGGSVEDQIVAAYLAFWDARFEANTGTPDPDAPALRATATGEQLVAVVGEAQANRDGGLAFAVRPNPADFRKVTVISTEGDRATVQECVVDDGLLVRQGSGEVVNDSVETHNARGELVREGGVWKVSRVELVQRWEGVGGCAAGS